MRSVVLGLVLGFGLNHGYCYAEGSPFTPDTLPYAEKDLEPDISANTLHYHYQKHYKGYVEKLNKMLKDHPTLQPLSLEEIIQTSYADESLKDVFNIAAQAWNHAFYWKSMKPKGGGEPPKKLLDLILKTFKSYDDFKEQFVKAGAKQFGSGWVWLVLNEKDQTLVIKTTGNADLPLAHGERALMTCDVWEHAYYLDYQNLREKYIKQFLDGLVNWDFAVANIPQ